LLFHVYAQHRSLHSFPTRRSSDLRLLAASVFPAALPEFATPTGIRAVLLNNDPIPDLVICGGELEGPGWDRCSAAPHGYQSAWRSEEHTSELQSQSNLVCRLLLEK